MSRAIKTAISLPLEEFKLIEALRRESHRSRSQILLEAIRTWLRVRKVQDLERRYVEGYQKQPEDATNIGELFKSGLASFNSEESW